jgi:hypothetical protein
MIINKYIYNILILVYLFILSYICNYYLLEYVSKYIYTSIISSLLIISIIDGFNLLDERDNLYIEYKNTHKLLELQIIENNKLETIIKSFKKT